MYRYCKVWKIVIHYVDAKGSRRMFVELCDTYPQCLSYLTYYSSKYRVNDYEVEKVVL